MKKDFMYKIEELNALPPAELITIGEKLKISNINTLDQQGMVYKILDTQALFISKNSVKKTVSVKNSKSIKEHDRPKKQGIAPQKTSMTPKKSNRNNNIRPTGNQEFQARRSARVHNENKVKYNKTSALQSLGPIEGEGLLDLMPDGYGFLRSSDYNYLSSPDDVYVSHNFVNTWGLRQGDTVAGKLRPPKEGEKYFGLVEITSVNHRSLEELRYRKNFYDYVPLFAKDQLRLTHRPNQYGSRIIDMFAPIGKGQRAIIVAPPKAGKTMLLKEIINGISYNHPDVYLMVLMIEERPEEVTYMSRSVKAEVIASTFDEQHENHIKVATLAIEKAKRLAETGYDVVIALDSLTRLARAYNIAMPSSGKILSGGVDAHALHIPKRFFGAARNLEDGGSITIIASALIDTGSKMDELIFQEFKGTGNMELELNRNLSEKKLYPSIDILRSSTRHSENMLPPGQVKITNMLRHLMSNMSGPQESLKFLLDNMKGTKTNEEFLASV